MKVVVGFTGTRFGMTEAQRVELINALRQLQPDEFHHGDCIGADVEAAYIVWGEPLNPDPRKSTRVDTKIICHPPVDESSRGFFPHNSGMRPPLPFLQRNKAIVEASTWVIACPREAKHQTRGGTWFTIDYAHDRRKPCLTICPDGSLIAGDPRLPGVKIQL